MTIKRVVRLAAACLYDETVIMPTNEGDGGGRSLAGQSDDRNCASGSVRYRSSAGAKSINYNQIKICESTQQRVRQRVPSQNTQGKSTNSNSNSTSGVMWCLSDQIDHVNLSCTPERKQSVIHFKHTNTCTGPAAAHKIQTKYV